MKVVIVSASNISGSNKESTSYRLCEKIARILKERDILSEIIDLREYPLSPCTGCGGCFDSRRCSRDRAFNAIYAKIAACDRVFFVSPHYAPIPAKLSMLLEKMEEITFLHWWKDPSYQSEVFNLPAGIISHGGGADWALKSYKAMVNDTIANALDTIQCRVIPYNDTWDTGISFPVAAVWETESIFPVQEYDWKAMEAQLTEYVEIVCRERDEGLAAEKV